MPTCNVDMWMNGVILTGVGSGLLIVSAILKSAMKSIKAEYRFSEKIEIQAKSMEIDTDIENNPVHKVRKRIDNKSKYEF